jgi:hypothetical protein
MALAEGNNWQPAGTGGVILSRLLVRFEIPIAQRSDNTGAPLMFSRWLPIGPENGIHYDRDNYYLVLWFNLACINQTRRHTEMSSIRAHTIYADVIINDLDDHFLQALSTCRA